jgi:hypothetical protein
MNTHLKTKEKLFDEVVKALANLAKDADEGCPHDYRSENFASSLFDAYDVLNMVAEDHINNIRSDESTKDVAL